MGRRTRTCKVIVEFPTPESALEWFDDLKAAGLLADRADLFEADALDLGRAAAGDYIARNSNDRPFYTSLRALVEARTKAFVAGGEKARDHIWKVRNTDADSE